MLHYPKPWSIKNYLYSLWLAIALYNICDISITTWHYWAVYLITCFLVDWVHD